jgi:hypothetical protein
LLMANSCGYASTFNYFSTVYSSSGRAVRPPRS